MTGIKDRRGVSNFYLTLYMSSAPSRTHSGTVAPGPSWPMYKPFAWPSSSHRSNPLAVGNEMKPSSAPAVMLVNGTSSCSGGNLVHDLTSVETKVMESYCQGYQLLCSSLAGGHRLVVFSSALTRMHTDATRWRNWRTPRAQSFTRVHLPVKDWTAPTVEQLKRAGAFLGGKSATLVHCKYGHRRIGTGITALQLFADNGQTLEPLASK